MIEKIFWWMVEVAQYNAYALYTLSQGSLDKNMSFLQFKESIIRALEAVAASESCNDVSPAPKRVPMSWTHKRG